MGTIFHAAGLYFGGDAPGAAERFLSDIEQEKPDLVIFSGDFTAHARKSEFAAAHDFLKRIKAPVLAVPGSRDYPRFNFLSRLCDPLALYRDYISPLQDTVHEDTDSFVVGINTARAFVPHWKRTQGMVSQEQIAYAHRHFRHADEDKLRILVCAHSPVETRGRHGNIAWGSTDLMYAMEDQHADLILCGGAQEVVTLAERGERTPLIVGGPPALREGYNILRLYPDRVEVQLIQRDGGSPVLLAQASRIRIRHDAEKETVEEVQ